MTKVLYTPTKPNARLIWQRSMPSECARAERAFWSDIILCVKEKPSKTVFFELLIRNMAADDKVENLVDLPFNTLVDKMIEMQDNFDDELWSEIIKEWTKIKIELKIRTQTVLLKNDAMIKDFLMAVLGKSENPRHLINKIAEESGLLSQYSKPDVIMMICSIVAESLMHKSEKREFDMDMKEGIFEIADDMEITGQKESGAIDGVRTELPDRPVEGSISLNDAPKNLDELFEDFIEAFSCLDPLENDWEQTEKYLGEIVDIASGKIMERDAIIKRRNLTTGYKNKLAYITDVFHAVLSDMGITLPESGSAEQLANEQLELFTDLFAGLHSALQKYSDLSGGRKVGLAEEKKRIAQLFTAMTDIENISGKIGKLMGTPQPVSNLPGNGINETIMDMVVVSNEEKAALLADYEEELPQAQEESPVPEEPQPDAETDVTETTDKEDEEDEIQIDLFPGRD